MSLLSTLSIGILTAIATLVLREFKSPLAPLITLSGGILLLSLLLPRLAPLLSWAQTLAKALPEAVGETVGKVLAAGFLCGTTAEICTELGSPTLASRIELAGKVEILLLSLPLFKELFSRVEVLLS